MSPIPIFLISDEKYAPYMCVTIASILENTKRNCDIFILDGGIKVTTQQKIVTFAKQHQSLREIAFIKIDIERFAKFPNLMHFSLNTYFRYLIPELKPELNKVLYIDSDIIITSDIGELFDTNMNGKPLAAVPYRDARPDLAHLASSDEHRELGLSKEHLYFNAGLLVIDCAQFRHNEWVRRLFDLTAQYADVLKFPDQDILNILTNCNYHVLDNKWNAVIDINQMYGVVPDELPSALHFTGGSNTRPWMSLSCPYREIFDTYAKATPFANEIYTQRVEHEIGNLKSILARLVQEEHNRKRAPWHRIWMRLTGRRKQNQQTYAQWAAILAKLNCKG